MKFLLVFIISLSLLACSNGTAPDKQWEMAVKGAYSASISRDGQSLLLGSIHHGGSFWQIEKFERLYNWNHEAGKMSGIVVSAISDNGLFASTSDHRKIALWNTKTGEAFWLWEAPADIQAMDLSNDGQFALLGLESYEAAMFDIQNGGVKFRMKHEGIVQTVDMSGDMSFAITGGDDSLVKVWNLQTGKELFSWRLLNQIKVVAISQDGRLGFASSYRGKSNIWDLTTGDLLVQLPKVEGHIQSARFNEDGTQLLTGTSSGFVDLWKVKSGLNMGRWKLAPRSGWVSKNTQVLDVAFSNGKFKAVGANGVTYQLSNK
jgi:WD40 repeat protein